MAPNAEIINGKKTFTVLGSLLFHITLLVLTAPRKQPRSFQHALR